MNVLHSHRKKFTCSFPDCSMDFYHVAALKQHMKAMHGMKVTFTAKTDEIKCLEVLTKQNEKRSLLKCVRGCKELFESLGALSFHMKTYHAQASGNRNSQVKKSFECYLCKKPESIKARLQAHIISRHSRRPRIKCPYPMCSKAFPEKTKLRRRTLTVHIKKSVFTCSKCPKRFYRSEKRKNHMRLMQGITN